MSPVVYTSGFRHQDWIDNQDRVEAGGDNGFNVRFHGLEGEFRTLEGVVTQISNAIDGLSAAPPVHELTTALSPALLPSGTSWDLLPGTASKRYGETEAAGTMSVSIPDGHRLLSFRAIGQKAGAGNLTLAISRARFSAGATPELIAQIAPTTPGAFDATEQIGANARVDNSTFKYFLTADLDSAAEGDTVVLNGFQIRHRPD